MTVKLTIPYIEMLRLKWAKSAEIMQWVLETEGAVSPHYATTPSEFVAGDASGTINFPDEVSAVMFKLRWL